MSSATVSASRADTLPIGYNLVGYEIVRVVGAGGFGITYEAHSPVTERRVAVKEFFPAGLARRDASSQVIYTQTEDGVISWALEKFKATTTLLARMEHPNILRVHHYMPLNDTGYMIMEYLEGETLHDLVRQKGRLSPDALRPILEPVLDALAYVHGQGLIHRDIAPDNIVLTRSGRPVLIDFGAVSRDLGHLSRALATQGIEKAGYTAPEQAIANARPEPTADIYSVGAVLYNGLTGQRPESGSERHSRITLYDEPDPLHSLSRRQVPGVSSEMASAVDACLALRRKDRPQCVDDLRGRLGWRASSEASVAGPAPRDGDAEFPLETQPPTTVDMDRPLIGRRRASALVATATALSLLLAGVAGGYLAGVFPLNGTLPATRQTEADRHGPEAKQAADVEEPHHAPAAKQAATDRRDHEAELAEKVRRDQEAQRIEEAQRELKLKQVQTIEHCDQSAASPLDKDRPKNIVGVEFERVDAPLASSSCRAAIELIGNTDLLTDVDKRRIYFEMGRTLDRAKEYSEAVVFYQRSADLKSAVALNNLASLYENGRGVVQNIELARQIYEDAAKNGSITALNSLGLIFTTNQEIKQDYQAARIWFEKAAAGANADAMINLGLFYMNGQGVEQDYTKARSWFEKALEKGQKSALQQIKILDERLENDRHVRTGNSQLDESAPPTGAVLAPPSIHESVVFSIALSPLRNIFASGSGDGTVKVWNTESGRYIRTDDFVSGRVFSVAFSPDGNLIASGGDDKIVKVANADSGASIRKLEGHNSWVKSVVFSPSGQQIVSGSYDRTIKIWDIKTNTLVRTLEGHTKVVNSVAISSDGHRIVSASDDYTIKLWDADSGQLLRSFDGASHGYESVAISPDQSKIVSGGIGKSPLTLWDVKSGKIIRSFQAETDTVLAVSFSPDGKYIASGSRDKTVKLWDTNSGNLLRTFTGHKDSIDSIFFTLDGQRIFSASWDRSIKAWDARKGTLLYTIGWR